MEGRVGARVSCYEEQDLHRKDFFFFFGSLRSGISFSSCLSSVHAIGREEVTYLWFFRKCGNPPLTSTTYEWGRKGDSPKIEGSGLKRRKKKRMNGEQMGPRILIKAW